jgi:hypothetical protein
LWDSFLHVPPGLASLISNSPGAIQIKPRNRGFKKNFDS